MPWDILSVCINTLTHPSYIFFWSHAILLLLWSYTIIMYTHAHTETHTHTQSDGLYISLVLLKTLGIMHVISQLKHLTTLN